jgi:uncharacterized protein
MLMNQSNIDERRAGFVHLYGVSQMCTLLGMKRNLNVEICAILGMLHDFNTYKCDDPTDHAALSAIGSEKILREIGTFAPEEIQLIVNAIKNHSEKASNHDIYREVLKYADSFQHYLYHTNLLKMDEIRISRIRGVLKELGLGNL